MFWTSPPWDVTFLTNVYMSSFSNSLHRSKNHSCSSVSPEMGKEGGVSDIAINRVRTPFERFKTGLVKVYGKVNSLVKCQPGESRRPASASHGGPVAFRQRRSGDSATVWRRRRTAAKAAETISGGGAWPSRARGGETLNGACGFIRTPIAAWSVATASSRREEYDDVFACARFSTVEKTKLGGVFIDKHLGPRVIAVAKSSNLVLMVLDASKHTWENRFWFSNVGDFQIAGKRRKNMDERGLIWLVQGEFKIGFESKELETRKSQTQLRLFSVTDEEASSNPTAILSQNVYPFFSTSPSLISISAAPPNRLYG
uniref:Uncharacterized protein n=1 Tax=Brassica oleracea TaxID=3712 RepID=A0A3P6AVA9_BRAOL|nr:unnamed protein product [Brassica oleracea]